MTERRAPGPDGHHPRKPEQHPLLQMKELPAWLTDVPIDNTKPTLVKFGEQKEKTVPIDLIVGALSSDVGTRTGTMTIAPELAQLFAQHTENPGWLTLPQETTTIQRTDEDAWEIEVGDYQETFTREALEKRVIETLLPPEENQQT